MHNPTKEQVELVKNMKVLLDKSSLKIYDKGEVLAFISQYLTTPDFLEYFLKTHLESYESPSDFPEFL